VLDKRRVEFFIKFPRGIVGNIKQRFLGVDVSLSKIPNTVNIKLRCLKLILVLFGKIAFSYLDVSKKARRFYSADFFERTTLFIENQQPSE